MAEKMNELVITYVFDAPLEAVWRAWTEPEEVMHWWGPKGFTTPVSQIDLRVGGKYLNCMRSPYGKDYWSTGVYKEIAKPERLVMTDSFSDENGVIVPATHYGMSTDFPLEMEITATFEEEEGKTKVTLHHKGMPAGKDMKGAGQGWTESFEKLAEHLKEPVVLVAQDKDAFTQNVPFRQAT